jgi:pyruvate dehydrogenase E2 component (dihydrolipoamide acetyltransferase)
LGVIAAADVDDAAIDQFIAGFAGGAAEDAVSEAPAAPAKAGGAGDAASRSSPSVRRLAQELDVDLNTVTGTGRRGRITEDDVRGAASGGGDSALAGVDVIPLSATRKTIAKRLTEAKQQIPHFYLTVEYELDGLLAHREKLNGEGGTRVSVNDLVVWCVAQALMKEPRVNVNFVDDSIHQFHSANVAVAIATDDGLYPATVYAAEAKSPAEIAASVAELAERAKSGKLTKEDISGGSFTVSNLGMFGVTNFTAIVNPPMGAILALGKGEQRMVVRDGAPVVATVVSATLSCDHRVIDGAVGARYLQVLGEEIAALL